MLKKNNNIGKRVGSVQLDAKSANTKSLAGAAENELRNSVANESNRDVPVVQKLPSSIRIDLAGERFGRLTVVGFAGYRGSSPMWVCKCDCGDMSQYYRTNLRSGTSTQCIHCCRAHHVQRSTVHSMWRSPEYRTWERVKRNSKVCKRWDKFATFYADVGDKPGEDYCLVRIKPADGWKPNNVHWVPRDKAQLNRGKRNMIKYNGETKCITDWARELGITPQSLRGRLKSGWTLKKALQTKTK